MNRTYPITTQKTPLWVEILITALGIIGAIVFITLNQQALPDASINLEYSRPQITEIAAKSLQALGFSAQDYHYVLSFTENRMSSFFLQQTLGVEQSNQKISAEKLPIYAWRARWFKPLQKEEYAVRLSTEGDLVGFAHTIPEDAPGTNVSIAEAQVLAENFLNANTGWEAQRWERVDASSFTQPGGRVDHAFGWKSLDYSAGDSELRYSVTIQGNSLGSLDYWIKTPEAYLRNFSSQRSRAGFINDIAYFLGLLGFLMACAIALVSGKPDKKQALIPALLGAGVSLASYLNYLPLFPASYNTTQDYALFWSGAVMNAFFSATYTFVMIFIAWMGGQALAKFVWPRQDRILARGPERWIEFSRSAWRGLMISGLHLGYVVTFYLLTSRFLGWWSPIGQGSASNVYATPFPFLEALDVGLNAALTEELLFRLAGISLILWISRKRWLALLIPGLLWAFAHLSYVSDPIYARGVELTFVALLDGFLFLQFGLLTTIVAHFSYNMIITSVALFQSSDPYYLFSGIVVLAILFALPLPGLVVWLKRRAKKAAAPAGFIVSPATPEDVTALSAFPVKADWPALLADQNRSTLCLRAEGKLLGFGTACVTEKGNAIVDGIYIVPGWRRMYWGSTLLRDLQEHFRDRTVTNLYAFVEPEDGKPTAFLRNLFWKTETTILAQGEAPTFRESLDKAKSAILKKRRGKAPEESGEHFELEIPHAPNL